MRSSLVVAVSLASFAVAACTPSVVQRQVKGVTFELTTKEIGLAEEYERQEPRTSDAQTRCDYWTKRRQDAEGNHLVGLFSWPPEYFERLRSWTDARRQESCEIAKAEAEARQAKANEQLRLDELADATREHEARDERAWTQAHVDECADGAREGACDGVKAYLDIEPGGRHAAQATAALGAAEPKLAQLRRLREQEAARRAALASKQEDAAGFRVSSMRAAIDDVPPGSSAPGVYLRVTFDLTAIRSLPRGVTPIVRGACQVAEKRMVDVDAGLDTHLDELAPGDTKLIDASPYAKRALLAAPSRCEIVVMKGVALETSGPLVRTFCYEPGQGVREGTCVP